MAFRDNIFYCRLEHKSKVLKVFFIVSGKLVRKKNYDDKMKMLVCSSNRLSILLLPP